MTKPGLKGLFQVGIVTADLDRALDTWAGRYGVGPWDVRNFDEARLAAEYDGEPALAPMRIAICQLEPYAMIELIQPVGDRGLYAESLARHGGADHVHHLALLTQDLEATSDGFASLGLRKLLDGTFAGATPDAGLQAVYFDTQADLGFLTEIVQIPAGLEFSAPDAVREA